MAPREIVGPPAGLTNEFTLREPIRFFYTRHTLVEDAMATTWDTLDRYVVISTDTHAGADLYGYKPYLPARLHEEFDAWPRTGAAD